MPEPTLEESITAIIRRELEPIRTRVNGIPIIGRAIEELRRDVRMIKASLNDMARENVTPGEMTTVHDDLDAIRSRQDELEARILALEETKS
jgi:hypothetical protein